jgi:flavin-dependent dehydrogenase
MPQISEEVLVVGAGPAGSIAGLILARAGVRVRLVDRDTFPRHKLCGDSLNPGAMALLARHGLAAPVSARGLLVRGMLLTGPGGAAVNGEYPNGVHGRSLRRYDFDRILLEAAIAAGAIFEPRVRVVSPLVASGSAGGVVTGVVTKSIDGAATERHARLIIAADGRRSALGVALGLARHPPRPRRWVLGAYFEGVSGLTDRGEMHVRRRRYLGVAPVPDGLVNACLVVPWATARRLMHAPGVALDAALLADEQLGPRFRDARRVTPVHVLGPLATDVRTAGAPGMLLAGDAAGFVDPMTGDGMRLAMRGAELAAEAALDALTSGAVDAHVMLAARRRLEFGGKLRVNRALRTFVDHPLAIAAAAASAGIAPSMFHALVRYAGDVP